MMKFRRALGAAIPLAWIMALATLASCMPAGFAAAATAIPSK